MRYLAHWQKLSDLDDGVKVGAPTIACNYSGLHSTSMIHYIHL